MNRANYKYVDESNPFFPLWEYKKKYRDRDPVLNPEASFYDYNMIERRLKQFDFDCNSQHLLLYFFRGKTSYFPKSTTFQELAQEKVHEITEEERYHLEEHSTTGEVCERNWKDFESLSVKVKDQCAQESCKGN